MASYGKSVACPLSIRGRVVAVVRLGLTATGGGFPVKGIIRLATLENLMFVFNLVSYFYLLFILLAPTPSWKL